MAKITGERWVAGRFVHLPETVRWQNPRIDTQVPNRPDLLCKASGVHDVKATDKFAWEIDGSAAVLGQAGLVFCQTCYERLATEQAVVERIRKNYERSTITRIGSPLKI